MSEMSTSDLIEVLKSKDREITENVWVDFCDVVKMTKDSFEGHLSELITGHWGWLSDVSYSVEGSDSERVELSVTATLEGDLESLLPEQRSARELVL